MPADAPGSTLRAGAARRDITPDNGGEFFGYARPDKLAEGVAIRLFAHALVLDDGEQTVALVAADLGAPKTREAVLKHVRPLGFDRETLLFACTHTHAGPDDSGEWIAAQIGDAVAAADERCRPALAGWGTAEVPDANRSRSVEAHLANHGQDHQPGTGTPDLDPDGPDHTRDTTLRMLRVERTDGTPIAAWAHFPVHPTAYTPHNTTFSADLAGVATRRFIETFANDAPLAMYTNGALGDLIPVYDDYNMHAVADRTGARIALGMEDAWQAAKNPLSSEVPVDGRATTAIYEGQEVEPGKRVASEAQFGLPFFGGGQNGPSLFFDAGLEGMRLPEDEADPVHGRKITVDTGPWAWDSEVEAQALRVGDRILLSTAGEPTTETGRRTRTAAAAVAPDMFKDIVPVGVANGYHGYFTTPQEYDQQHYEGGHTVFGKYTALVLEQTHVDLVQELVNGDAASRGSSGTRPETPAAPVGGGSDNATLTDGPPATVERMAIVTVGWEGGPGGRDRPVGEPFLVLERRDDGAWTTAATDLGLGFVWREEDGTYQARYDVPPDLPTGTYRFRVRGAEYDLETDSFEIRPSTALRVRGVRAEHHGAATTLVFLAQNPAPDPDRHLRTRSVIPCGGSLTFEVGGMKREADWDEDRGGWTAVVGDTTEGDRVTVPEGGLVDSSGNRSGAAVALTVGQVKNVEWPPHIGSGGERPSAPSDLTNLLSEVQKLIGADGD